MGQVRLINTTEINIEYRMSNTECRSGLITRRDQQGYLNTKLSSTHLVNTSILEIRRSIFVIHLFFGALQVLQ